MKYEAVKAAKMIKQELKKSFPGVKFSVKTWICTCINIRWENGPLPDDVQKIADRYERVDSSVLPQAEAVSAQRTLTDGIYDKAFEDSKKYFSIFKNAKSLDDKVGDYLNARSFIYERLRELDLTNGYDFEQFKQAI